jgi:hypothetical protein
MDHVDRLQQPRAAQAAYAARLAVVFHFMKRLFQCYLRQFSGLSRRAADTAVDAARDYYTAAKTSFRCDFSETFRHVRRRGRGAYPPLPPLSA